MIEAHPATVEAVAPALARAAHFDTTGGTAKLGDMLHGAQGFRLTLDGVDVGAYALRVQEHSAARVAWVMVASGHAPGHDLTSEVLPTIEQQANALRCEQLAVTTIRPGLVRKLKARGWAVTGITLRKNIR